MNFVELSHKLALEFAGKNGADSVIDATLGRGRDALFAAQNLLADGGELAGFDIQKSAVEQSLKLLESKAEAFDENGVQIFGGRKIKVSFFEKSHAEMEKFVYTKDAKVRVFFFNLGWLPTSDKSTITKPQSTIAALEAALRMGKNARTAMSVLSYRGHGGGAEEFAAVENFFNARAKNFGTFKDCENAASPVLFFAKLQK